jgi:hypothetical protein
VCLCVCLCVCVCVRERERERVFDEVNISVGVIGSTSIPLCETLAICLNLFDLVIFSLK